ncbi:MAG TPA: N-acetyl-gamma-glutamyl-phosphate reductase [Chthoniobacterales bacterium]|nr:N-acetyl-gamma-glutamyl-phosphate reductase [Chthoniobacterales bacterium]
MESTKVAVFGASGYTGEELVRLLLRHPHAELVAVTSRQYAGQTVAEVFPRAGSYSAARTLQFTDAAPERIGKQAEVAFLALPHGVAVEFAGPLLRAGARVIDLSADFRIKNPATYREFYAHEHGASDLLAEAVYGLPEIYREKIAGAHLVACPGCYPTSILLPLIPLLREKLIEPGNIIANSLSGVSGAGRKAETDYLFVECNESMRPYGVPKHRHLAEIEQELSIAAGAGVTIQFTPHLIPVNRGILTTLYLTPTNANAAAAAFEKAYGDAPFVRLLGEKALPDTKNVVGSNVIEIAWRHDPRTGRLIVMSAEDNLVKGASGQAVQCFNVMCGYEETAGLI